MVCEHISATLEPSSSSSAAFRRRNILFRSGGLFLVTLAKWKGGAGMAGESPLSTALLKLIHCFDFTFHWELPDMMSAKILAFLTPFPPFRIWI